MKTVLYARSSISTQEHSIEMQRLMAWEKAKQEGILIDDLYLDEAVSARKTKMEERPQLTRLIQDINNDEIGQLLVYKRDRLARNVTQYMEIYELLKEKNVRVIFTAANELSLQFSPAGEFFELVMAGFNEREANQIVQRIKETKFTMTRMGKHSGGPLPYGYTLDNEKHYIKVSKEENIIRTVYNELLNTDCETLSDFVTGLVAKNTIPNNWNNARVQRLIENRIYKGIRIIKEFGDIVEIENEEIAVVSEALWDEAQEKLNSIVQRRARKTSLISTYLDGLIICGRCKTPLTARTKDESEDDSEDYYYCKDHSYYKYRVSEMEEKIMDTCIMFADNLFQTQSEAVFDFILPSHKRAFLQSVKEGKEAILKVEQALFEQTQQWLSNPTQEQQSRLLELYQMLYQEQIILEENERRLKAVERLPLLLKSIAGSISMKDMVVSLKENWGVLFQDLIRGVETHRRELRLILKYPFTGEVLPNEIDIV